MKPRHKRFILVGSGLVALAVAAGFVLAAFQKNLVFFFTPSQVAANEAPAGRSFRIGGLVEKGSLKRQPDGITRIRRRVLEALHSDWRSHRWRVLRYQPEPYPCNPTRGAGFAAGETDGCKDYGLKGHRS